MGSIERQCERAVVTAYRDLRRGGVDDLTAFGSCTRLYRIHHPDASLGEARRLVAEWIDRHVLSEAASIGGHGDARPGMNGSAPLTGMGD